MTLISPTDSQSTMAKSYGVGGVDYHLSLTDTAKMTTGVPSAANRGGILAPPRRWRFEACSRAVRSSRKPHVRSAHGTQRQAGRPMSVWRPIVRRGRARLAATGLALARGLFDRLDVGLAARFSVGRSVCLCGVIGVEGLHWTLEGANFPRPYYSIQGKAVVSAAAVISIHTRCILCVPSTPFFD